MRALKTMDEAKAAYAQLDDDAKEAIGADLARGVDPLHAINLARSRHMQDVARTGAQAEDELAPATTGDSARAFAISAGDSAMAGALPTAVAALDAARGRGTFAENKRDNVETLEALRLKSPWASGAGDVVGAAAPAVGAGVASLAQKAAPTLLTLAAPGAVQGGLAGAGMIDEGTAGEAALKIGGGMLGGALLGVAPQALQKAALRVAPTLGRSAGEALAAPVQTARGVASDLGANVVAPAKDAGARAGAALLRLGAKGAERAPMALGGAVGHSVGSIPGAAVGAVVGDAVLGNAGKAAAAKLEGLALKLRPSTTAPSPFTTSLADDIGAAVPEASGLDLARPAPTGPRLRFTEPVDDVVGAAAPAVTPQQAEAVVGALERGADPADLAAKTGLEKQDVAQVALDARTQGTSTSPANGQPRAEPPPAPTPTPQHPNALILERMRKQFPQAFEPPPPPDVAPPLPEGWQPPAHWAEARAARGAPPETPSAPEAYPSAEWDRLTSPRPAPKEPLTAASLDDAVREGAAKGEPLKDLARRLGVRQGDIAGRYRIAKNEANRAAVQNALGARAATR